MGRIIRLGRFGADPDLVKGLVPLARELHNLKRADRLAALADMKPNTIAALRQLDYEWLLFARPEQLPPATDDWRWWLMCGGRGGGKTRSAVEYVIQWAWDHPGDRAAFVSKDVSGYRRIMLRGNAGVLKRSPPWFKPRWWKTDKLLEWPNGTIAELHTSEEPETLRGPEYHFAWITELFHWTIPRGEYGPTAYESGIKFGLRLGQWPHGIIDSTPLPTPFCADFMYGAENEDTGARVIEMEQVESGEWRMAHEVEVDGEPHRYSVEIRRWDSEKNAANLSKGFVQELKKEHGEGVTADLEMRGIINLRPKGALFTWQDLESFSVPGIPRMKLVYVAVDPTRAEAPVDECGIMVGGLGYDGHVYVWEDRSTKGPPKKYAAVVVSAANENRADAVVLEKNRLPQKTRSLIRTTPSAQDIRWIEVVASENKLTRAEPVSKVVADGIVHFVLSPSTDEKVGKSKSDKFRRLWTELVMWDPRRDRRSPSRMDAFVWLVTALLKLDTPDRKEIF